MDVKVYQKEEVLQPDGVADVLTPDIIDFIVIEENGVINHCSAPTRAAG